MTAEALPGWLHPLATAAAAARGEDLSRFLPPTDGTGRASAVLMAFADLATAADEPARPGVLLLERAARMRQHAGQVAFPGGAVDHGETAVDAALREANEEVGLEPASVRVLTELPAVFIPVTRFVVTPVLAWWTRPHPVHARIAAEVAVVRVVPVATLVDPANRFRVRHPSGWIGPGFEAEGLFVWGFTAGLLDRLLSLAGWAVPWDETLVRPLPEPQVDVVTP